MKKIIVLIAVVILFAACRFDFDEKRRSDEAGFVPVESIYGVPTGGMPNVVTGLFGTVIPENATNKKIEWSIKSDGATNSTLNGARLSAANVGTVIVTATIKNGLAEGVDYTEDFEIDISLEGIFPVREINGIPASVLVGQYTLNGIVAPTNTVNKTITWSVVSAGTTGAEIYANTLTTTAKGTITIKGTVANGLLYGRDFTQDFTIAVMRSVYATGEYGTDNTSFRKAPNGSYQACYWIDGERHDLDDDGNNYSYTSGIVFTGGKNYIAGFYGSVGMTWSIVDSAVVTGNKIPCYWVNGERKTLPDSSNAPITSATANTRTFSIAADTNGDVYITGLVNSNHCLWKINANSETVSYTPLNVPTGVGTVYGVGGIARDGPLYYNGRFAVRNGKVRIPFIMNQAYDYRNYYWDENGDSTPITSDLSSTFWVTSAAIMDDGTVYFAGGTGEYVVDPKPVYIVHGKYALLDDQDGYVYSIIVQNGAPLFFIRDIFSYESAALYWDTAKHKTFLPASLFIYSLTDVIFSDGNVYTRVTDDANPDTYGAIGEEIGYTVLSSGRSHQTNLVTHMEFDGNDGLPWGTVTGIALKP